MADSVGALYAGLVVGIPLAYVILVAFRHRKLWPLAGAGAGVLVLLSFPSWVLPLAWSFSLAVMGVCIAIVLAHVAISVRLLYLSRSPPALTGNRPTVAVLIAARNEGRVIAGCLDSLLHCTYPADRLQVIVIDDASTDETARCVMAYQRRHPNVHLLIRSASAVRGKAAALNQALSEVKAEFTTILDADHHVAETFFSTILPHFQDPRVGAVQVRKMGRNWSSSLLTRLIELESLGWQYCFLDTKSYAKLVTVYFGSGCVFRTSILRHLAGLNNELATEDLEASLRLYGEGYRIEFEPGTFTTDELASDCPSFFRQRYRWARGTTQAIRQQWRSFYRSGRTTLREKLDFCFFPVLLCLMIVPFFQVATHALANFLRVALPLVQIPLPAYSLTISACYVVAGLRNRREGGGRGPRGFVDVVLLSLTMCLFYGLFLAITNLRAFLDEFVLQVPYRPSKTAHYGTERMHNRVSSTRHWRTPCLEQRIVSILGCPSCEPDHVRSVAGLLVGADWKVITDLARAHRVLGFLDSNLVNCGLEAVIPPTIRRDWLAFRRAILARNLYLQHAWLAIMETFADANIEVIVLKGMLLINRLLAPDVRPLYDVDLLVRRSQVEEASRQLTTLGYQPLPDSNIKGGEWCTQRSYRHPKTGVVIDLHWDLVNSYNHQRVNALPIDRIWERARLLPGQRSVYEMTPEDLVLHTALHSGVHHDFSSLSYFADLRAVLQEYSHRLNWEGLVALAVAARAKTIAYWALWMTRRLFDAPVPQWVVRALQPPRYRRLCFRWFLSDALAMVDGRLSPGRTQPWWAPSDLHPGWGSIVLADSLADSVRATSAGLAFGLAAFGMAVKRWNRVS